MTVKPKYFIILLAVLLCCEIEELFLPLPSAAAVLYDPPPIYEDWLMEVRTCLLTMGPIKSDIRSVYRVSWYRVPDSSWNLIGRWNSYRKTFEISESYIYSEYVVKHEMIHSFGFSFHNSLIFNSCTI